MKDGIVGDGDLTRRSVRKGTDKVNLCLFCPRMREGWGVWIKEDW